MKLGLALLFFGAFGGAFAQADIVQISFTGRLMPYSWLQAPSMDRGTGWDASVCSTRDLANPMHLPETQYWVAIDFDNTVPNVSPQATGDGIMYSWSVGVNGTEAISFGDYSLKATNLQVQLYVSKKLQASLCIISGTGVLPDGKPFYCFVKLATNVPPNSVSLTGLHSLIFAPDLAPHFGIKKMGDPFSDLGGQIDPSSFVDLTTKRNEFVSSDQKRIITAAVNSVASHGNASAQSPPGTSLSEPFIGSVGFVYQGPFGTRASLSVNPNGVPASAYFEYGLTTNYGFETPVQNVGSSSFPVNVETLFPDLSPDTTYHFRLVVISAAGCFFGPDAVFTTQPSNSAKGGE